MQLLSLYLQLLILRDLGKDGDVMSSYAKKFIKARGETAVIERTPPVNTKVSIKRSTRSARDLGVREAYWEGILPLEDNLKSGEYITIRGDKHLVQSVNFDKECLETAFFATKCNCTVNHQREVETGVDEWNNILKEWQNVSSSFVDIPSYCEIVTYRMRQEDPGLLNTTKYVFQLPKSIDVQLLDRIVYNNEKLRVDSINDTGMSGVVLIQVTDDVRP